MSLSTKMVAVALRLLTAHGYSLTLRTIVDTTPATTTAYEPTRTPTDVTVKGILAMGVFDELSPIGGGVVADTQRHYTIAASGLAAAPAVGDILVDDSIAYEIRKVEPVSPAGVPILYDLLCE